MIRIAKSAVLGLAAIVAAIALLIAWQLTRPNIPPPSLAYTVFFSELCDSASAGGYHLLIYLDIQSCLSCTEDMDAWRNTETLLADIGGTLSLWTPASDSIDVAEAMRLEGMQAPVRILDSSIVSELGWKNLGTPVKALLDSQCRLVQIEGRMGNVRESKCFFDEITELLRLRGKLAAGY